MKMNNDGVAQLLAVSENVAIVAAATSLRLDQRIVRLTTTSAAYAVTLPPVAEAAGMVFSFYGDTISLSYAVTIQDRNESTGWKDIVISRKAQYVILLSDGASWRVIASNLPGTTNNIVEVFDRAGAIGYSTGATGYVNSYVAAGGTAFEYIVLGAGQTKLGPVIDTTVGGLDVSGDAADNEGFEYTTGIVSGAPGQFTVGVAPFFARLRFTIADVSDTDDCAFGFRKREAYQANVDDYDEMAALNVISGTIKQETILNGAGTVTTANTDAWADTETHELEVRVSKTGLVTFRIDGAAPTVAEAAFTFDAGEVVIPFFFFLHAAASTAGIVLKRFECGYM